MDTATEHAWHVIGLLEKTGLHLTHVHACVIRDATEKRDTEHGKTQLDLVRSQMPARKPFGTG